MHIAVDTNILVRAFIYGDQSHLEVTTLVARRDGICQDHGGVIAREYARNVGDSPMFRKWYVRLRQRGAIHLCSGQVSAEHCSVLCGLGCHEVSDHVFIGVAFHSDRILVSEDSDVGKGPNGHVMPHPKALSYLVDTMKVRVYDADEACHQLWP